MAATEAPEDPSPDDVTPQEVLDFLELVIRDDPWVLFVGLLSTLTIGAMFLSFMVWGITRAGRYSPPVVVVTIVLGLVALFALLTYVLQPTNDALGQIVAAAVGALGGALGTAFAERKFQEKELQYLAEQEAKRHEQSSQPEGDGEHAGSGGGVAGDDSGDGDLAGPADGDAGSDGPGSPRHGRNGAPWVERQRSSEEPQ